MLETLVQQSIIPLGADTYLRIQMQFSYGKDGTRTPSPIIHGRPETSGDAAEVDGADEAETTTRETEKTVD